MKFALLTVSYGGLFYKGKALSLEQQIHKAKELGFDALSIETKRPVASPIDLSKSERTRIREIAAAEGIVLCAIESLSNFTSSFMEERENNIAMMQYVLELARDLDIDIVKIFAAWPGITNDEDEIALYGPFDRIPYYKRLFPADLRKWNRAVQGIREVADRAADLGITLALQNHAPVIRPGYEDVLSMMQEIDKSNVKLCLDLPLFYDRQSDEYIHEAIEHCGKHTILTHFGSWNFSQKADGEIVEDPSPSFGGQTNYKTFFNSLLGAGYEGYLVSEYCLPALKNHQVAGIEEIDKGTRLSLKYMKDLLKVPNAAQTKKHAII
ncbi:MAG TPA: sugar phosphate isomerase/epimerase family protein [Puia sp.]|nr:sugar phosphate isomerase/epimerase family protein [Puia sp.]